MTIKTNTPQAIALIEAKRTIRLMDHLKAKAEAAPSPERARRCMEVHDRLIPIRDSFMATAFGG